jgi:hypothetical protein
VHDDRVDLAADLATGPVPKAFGLIATKLARPDGEQGMLVKGFFNVAASSVLPVNPATNGIHIYAADAMGTLFDVSLPGGPGCDSGDGWTTGGPSTRTIWKYRNRSGALPPACTPGSAQGVASVQIKDSRQATKQALQFKAKAKSATLLRDPNVPLTRVQVSFALAAQPAPGVASPQARSGQCAEAVFSGNSDSDLAEAVLQDQAQERRARRRDLQGPLSDAIQDCRRHDGG